MRYSTSGLVGAAFCAACRLLRASFGLLARNASSARPTSLCTLGVRADNPTEDAASSASDNGIISIVILATERSLTSRFFSSSLIFQRDDLNHELAEY